MLSMMGAVWAGAGTKSCSIMFDGLAVSMIFCIYERERKLSAGYARDPFEHQRGHMNLLRG
jgi:hypothetical protein